MKKTLILLSFVLSFATAGLFAQAATDPVVTSPAQTQTAPAQVAKHKHKKHKKQAKQQSKRHHKHHKKTGN